MTFGALHVLYRGPLPDGTPEEVQARLDEIAARDAANIAWVDEVFDTAVAQDSKSVLLLMQANPTNKPAALGARIAARAHDFAKQVVIAHGDGHVALVTPDFLGEANIVRWQVGGGPGAVESWSKVDVDCSAPDPISQVDVQVGTTPATTTTSTTTTTIAPTAVPIDGPAAATAVAVRLADSQLSNAG